MYAHLHNHTSASMFDGAQSPETLAERVDSLGMDGVALTDHGHCYAWPEFQVACEERGLKPILGIEAYLVEDFGEVDRVRDKPSASRSEYEQDILNQSFHQVLIAKTQRGLQNLMKLSSWAGTDGFYSKPKIDFARMRRFSEGLIATSSCVQGIIPQAMVAGDMFRHFSRPERIQKVRELTERYLDIFGDNFYLEAHRHGYEDEETVAKGVKWLSRQYDIDIITANDCHYPTEDDFWLQDVKTCISMSDPGDPEFVDDPDRMQYAHENLYVKGAEEMIELFPEFPEAAQNTVDILAECDARLPLDDGEYYFPDYPELQDNETPAERLKRECAHRFLDRYPNPTEQHKERMRYELGVIRDMGFSDYFLIVKDIVEAARARGVPVGPGRGSAAGSMVSYVLGITNLDPIEHGLLFDRFLNPERQTMPDIDIDFDDSRRGEVVDYIYERYGEDRVAQIITFNRYKTKNTIKDAGKVFRMEPSELNKITSRIDDDRRSDPISEILEHNDELDHLRQTDSRFERVCRVAENLYGMESHTGIHAAAIVVTPGELDSYLPVEYDDGNRYSDGILRTQFDGDELEDIGLLKMDILGLKTLREIRLATEMAQKRDPAFDASALTDRDDTDVYEHIFGEGRTIGVFQFGSPPMREALRQMKPKQFKDITAMNALYRPGPLQFLDNYIDRMHGEEEVEYFHPDAKPYLEDTYGIMVFQEQIMQVCRELAGFSLGEADILRRAVGKKKRKLLMKQKEKFIDGCQDTKGMSKTKAESIFENIEKFARYGFNRSHAAAYSALAYKQAYLKHYYPAAFFAASIRAQDDDDKRAALISEAEVFGIDVQRPSVNESEEYFAPVGDQDVIRFGLGSLKHVGQEAQNILDERDANGSFQSFMDFVTRVIPNKTAAQSLVQAGALDDFDLSRAAMYEQLEEALTYARKMRDKRRGKRKSEPDRPDLSDQEEWPAKMRFQQEREVARIYTTGHPADRYHRVAEHLDGTEFIRRSSRYGNTKYRAQVGAILTVDEATTRNDNPMWWVRYLTQDGDIRKEPIFQNRYDDLQEHLRRDEPVVLLGRADTDGEYADQYTIDGIVPMRRALGVLAQVVQVHTHTPEAAKEVLRYSKRLSDGDLQLWVKGPGSDGTETVRLKRTVRLDYDHLNDLSQLGQVDVY